MPNRNKRKQGPGAFMRKAPALSQGEVFRNFFAVPDDVDPMESLRYMQEMFRGKIDPDVVTMIFSECAYDVDQALESLIVLTNDQQNATRNPSVSIPKIEQRDNSAWSPKQGGKRSQEKGSFTVPSSIQKPRMSPEKCFAEKNRTNGCAVKVSTGNLPPQGTCVASGAIIQSSNIPKVPGKLSTENYMPCCSLPLTTVPEGTNVPEYSVAQSCSSGPGSRSVFHNITHTKPFFPSTFYTGASDKNNHSFFSPMSNNFSQFQGQEVQFLTPFLPVQNQRLPSNLQSRGKFQVSERPAQGRQEHSDFIEKVNSIRRDMRSGEKVMVILRGLPGSGKSTLAGELKEKGAVLSTDDYFCRSGRYVFDVRKLSYAHEWNHKRTSKALRKGISPVIVDNTNVEKWELVPYVDLGVQFGYRIYILEPDTPWKFKLNKLARKNTHHVSKDKIERMLERYDHSVTVEEIVKTLQRSKPTQISNNSGDDLNTKTAVNDNCSAVRADSDDSLLSMPGIVGDSSKIISLEAVVHQEDESSCSASDIHEDISNSEMAVVCDSGTDVQNTPSPIPVNDQEFDDHIPSGGSPCSEPEEERHISDLNELRDLLREDSEESQSQHVPSADSSQDISGWEAITERDDDFQWSGAIPLPAASDDHCTDSSQDVLIIQQESTGSSTITTTTTTCFIQDSLIDFSDNECNSSSLISSEKAPDHTEDFRTKDWSEPLPRSETDTVKNDVTDSLTQPLIDIVPLSAADSNVKHPDIVAALPKPPRDEKCLHTRRSSLLHGNSMDDDAEISIPSPKPVASDFDWTTFDGGGDKGWSDSTSGAGGDIGQPAAISEPKPQRKRLLKEPIEKNDNSSDKVITDPPSTDDGNIVPKKNEKVRIAANLDRLSFSEKFSNETDWSFPQFDGKGPDADELPTEETALPMLTSGTQTEPSDFVTLHHVENNPLYISDMKVLVASSKSSVISPYQHVQVDAIPKYARFDKSTSTSDIDNISKISENIGFLRSCFPEISDGDLKHLLELCHDDSTWATNIVLEWGYKYNVPENCGSSASLSREHSQEKIDSAQPPDDETAYTEPPVELNNGPDAVEVSDIHAEEELHNYSRSVEESIQPSDDGVHSGYAAPSFEDQSFNLTLDPAFAVQLEHLFGPVSEDEDRFLPANLVVNVDLNLAKHIYHRWRQTLETSQNVSEKGLFINDQELSQSGMKLQQFVDMMNKSGEPLPLSQIMDMEEALQLHYKEEMKKLRPSSQSFATKLKRMELYRMFPGVDTLALDNVFEANSCSLKQTILALEEDIGKPAKLPDGNISPVNAEAEKEEPKDNGPFSDFINENWSDWVHQDAFTSNDVHDGLPEEAIHTPEIETIRAEAAMHYQLRQELMRKAHSAHTRGMRDAASFYAQKGDFHLSKFKEANRRASELILETRNKGLGLSTLDLHGLYAQEAVRALTRFLNHKKSELNSQNTGEQQDVTVITGRGAHSLRVPKLRPCVINYLKSNGYRFDEISLGVFIVHLYPAQC